MTDYQPYIDSRRTADSDALSGTSPAAPAQKGRGFSVHPLIVSLCIFAAFKLCPSLAGTVWQTAAIVPAETVLIEQVLDQTLTAGRARDAAAIYALMTDESHQTVAFSEIEQLVGGYHYAAFAGYRGLSIASISMDWRPPTSADVSGSIEYDDGYVGGLLATLVKANGAWKVHAFNINVPAAKIAAFR